MVFWNLYFLGKLALSLSGALSLQFTLNALLLLVVAGKHRYMKRQRFGLWSGLAEVLLLVPAGLALALHEFGLVVNANLLLQIRNLLGFSNEYLFELVRRTLEPEMIWAALAGLIILRVFNRYLRLSAWTLSALLVFGVVTQVREYQAQESASLNSRQSAETIKLRDGAFAAERMALSPEEFARLQHSRNPLLPSSNRSLGGPDGQLKQFYAQQAQVLSSGFVNAKQAPDFDVIVLHVCSMAWADIQASKLSTHPILTNADLQFTRFNTVSSYSGPATLRFLRGNCGQVVHKELYNASNAECNLYQGLRLSGYQLQMGMNHNGAFDKFKAQVLAHLPEGVEEPVNHKSATPALTAFDGSAIARDEDYLLRWWAARQKKEGPPVAYYYNTISLHDGNLIPGSKLGSMESYPQRLERLLDDFSSLLRAIKNTDRKALVMIVPEHGAGLSGEFGQLAGLREIPTPAITLAPVLAYWIDPDYVRDPNTTYPVQIKQPTSYKALAEFISRWLKTPAQQRQKPIWPLIVGDLPTTEFVAEEGEVTVLEQDNKYWLKSPGSDWQALSNNKAPLAR